MEACRLVSPDSRCPDVVTGTVLLAHQVCLLLPQRETLKYPFAYWWSEQILKLTHCKRVFSTALNKSKKNTNPTLKLCQIE